MDVWWITMGRSDCLALPHTVLSDCSKWALSAVMCQQNTSLSENAYSQKAKCFVETGWFWLNFPQNRSCHVRFKTHLDPDDMTSCGSGSLSVLRAPIPSSAVVPSIYRAPCYVARSMEAPAVLSWARAPCHYEELSSLSLKQYLESFWVPYQNAERPQVLEWASMVCQATTWAASYVKSLETLGSSTPRQSTWQGCHALRGLGIPDNNWLKIVWFLSVSVASSSETDKIFGDFC